MTETIKAYYVYDFRIFLKNELERRVSNNPNYSLRAFAKFLEIEASYLSKILKNERIVNIKLIDKFSEKFGLSNENIERLKFLYNVRKDPSLFEEFVDPSTYQKIKSDHFKIISDWKHYAVLEAMKFDGFCHDTNWVSKKLQIDIDETKEIIIRLQETGLLIIDENGIWHDVSMGSSSHCLGPIVTSEANKQYQKELLRMAIENINTTPIEFRENSSIMIATSKNKIVEAKQLIKDFRRKLAHFLGEVDEIDDIYHLGVCLYPIKGDENET